MTSEERTAIAKEVTELLPLHPGAENLHIARERGLIKGDVIVFKAASVFDPMQDRRRIMAECHCTSCGEEFYFEKAEKGETGCHGSYGYSSSIGYYDPETNEIIRNKDSCICPFCGMTGQAIHTSSFGNKKEYVIDSGWIMTFHNIKGYGCLLTWKIEKATTKEGTVNYIAHREEGIICVDGKLFRATGYVNGMFGAHCYYDSWILRKRFDPAYFEKWSTEEIMPIGSAAVESSSLCKSAIDLFLTSQSNTSSFHPGCYLALWQKHPNIENLIRSGLSKYVSEVISLSTGQAGYGYTTAIFFEQKRTNEFIEWKKKKPHEMLGIEKSEIRIPDHGVYPLKIYKLAKKQKKGHEPILTAENFETVQIRPKALYEILQPETYRNYGEYIPNVKKTLNYLKKINFTGEGTIYILRDYWRMTLGVYSSIPPELEYPKNLKAAHDIINDKYEAKKDALLDERIKSRYKDLKIFAYTDKKLGLTIIPPRSHDDFVREGKKLKHCVETYSTDHSTANTTILFIRKLSDINSPFFTLEYKNGRVNQNRGFRNCARTKEVEKFEAEWLTYIKGVLKNGKRNNAAKQLCTVGA